MASMKKPQYDVQIAENVARLLRSGWGWETTSVDAYGWITATGHTSSDLSVGAVIRIGDGVNPTDADVVLNGTDRVDSVELPGYVSPDMLHRLAITNAEIDWQSEWEEGG
jgi:hypothetical protein